MEDKYQKRTNNPIYLIFRIFMVTISIFFAGWFLLPFFVYNILNAYNLMGILACVYIMLFYMFRGSFIKFRGKLYENKFSKILWQTGRFLIYTFGVYALILSIIMCVCASIQPSENATAIVLGAQVKGTQPTLSLYDRILAGEDYLKKNPDAVCVASGGLGDTAQITEAQCVYNVMTADGIDGNRIYLENNAKSTKENIEFAYQIIKENGENENIAIVSDTFHQARARLIATKLGISGNIGAVSANTNWIYMPTFWVREWFGLPYDMFFR